MVNKSIEALTNPGSNPLHLAAMSGSVEAVESLLSRGSDLHARSPRGLTALHFAAWSGHAEVAATLLAHGADANAQTDDGWTPRQFAVYHGHTEIVELLRQQGASGMEQTKEGVVGMKIMEIQQKARALGLKTEKMKKTELIRLIQQTEGNTPCYNTTVTDCPHLACCFRDDCDCKNG